MEKKIPVLKANLLNAIFTFTMPDNSTFAAHWSLNITAVDTNKKYEVSIFYGGGYLESYYSDFRISEKSSKEYIQKTITTKKATL